MMIVMIKYTEKESVSLVPYGSGINDLDALAVVIKLWLKHIFSRKSRIC